ncbi:MAG: DUF4276 family protein [Proteobacteria bacterium]|uniref:DUF4276 family protein n=1 Tax=Thauera sp. 2A1 TaxID=2570191 RepID=UPI0012909E95|nr:DUF4276 family protein [Thauera sp. 2A1]KAI5915608.1 DUF4276 family protein [Thauera sp. 2A1]MBS0353511.1 DUF4276 family protein [Pseudomonadota bacterium]
MRELVFLLEEPSAKAMLESLLPRMLQEDIRFRCIPFEGKQDLEKQLTRRIRAYQNERARFIVLRDQDSHPDCTAVKQGLLDLCEKSGKFARCFVRIACRELETFYLADLQAVEQALEIDGLTRHQNSRKFRSPDGLGSPSRELKTLTGNRYEKVAGSRAIGKHLQIDNARSASFRNLIAAIRRCEDELLREAV